MTTQSSLSDKQTGSSVFGEEYPPTVLSEESRIWQAAVQKYYTELAKGGIKGPAIDKDLWKIESPVDLLDEIRAVQPQNSGLSRAWMGSLQRLEPILLGLNDFAIVTAWALGMNGKVSAVVWGSIRLILNVGDTLNVPNLGI
jgi:hypothetical protein